MDNQRLLVWAAFGLLAFMTYQTWLLDNAPKPAEIQEQTTNATNGLAPPDASLPSLPVGGDESVPSLQSEAPSVSIGPPGSTTETPSRAQTIHVDTDVFSLEISLAGGVIEGAKLKQYPVAKDQPDTLIQLLSNGERRFASLQSGLIADESDDEAYFNALLTADQSEYRLDSNDELLVSLNWRGVSGVRVEKRLRFTRGSYRIDVEHIVTNGSDSNWRAASYDVLKRHAEAGERSMFDVDSYSFDGMIVYDGSKSEKLDYDDLLDGPFQSQAANGWLAGIEHHFLSAIVPQDGESYRYDVSVRSGRAKASAFGPAVSVPPGGQHTFTTTLFVGPKLQSQLEEIAPKLTLTVDYGILTLLSNPLFWLLSKVFSFVANWGVAIILVTVLIKAAFYKLTEKSGRSMAKMREIQPRMKALQDRYKDDKQQLSQAMMELYKREKVNPAAGCLPILIQMPFFLAFYWVLLESVEMRQAPFALWITDLSSRDPYFILPLIMGAAMLFQQKLNPAPADPVQAKVMQIMPIMFTGFFAFFPSGLVLYWVTNTLLSIAQQWYVNKVVEQERIDRKGKK